MTPLGLLLGAVNLAIWGAFGWSLETARQTGSRSRARRSATPALALLGGVSMFVIGART